MEFNREKYKNLLLYIFCGTEPCELGAVKLNKILWYSDVNAYLLYGQSITGENYVKRQHGPMSKHSYSVLEEMEASDNIIIKDVQYFTYTKKEYTPLVKPDLSYFTAQEISLVDQFVNKICREFTARGISEQSHNRLWELAEFGEEIPYEAVFSAEMGEIDDLDMEWAREHLETVRA